MTSNVFELDFDGLLYMIRKMSLFTIYTKVFGIMGHQVSNLILAQFTVEGCFCTVLQIFLFILTEKRRIVI